MWWQEIYNKFWTNLSLLLSRERYILNYSQQNLCQVLLIRCLVFLMHLNLQTTIDASSIAGLLITTEAMIADKPEEKDSGPAMPPGGMGGMGM